MQAYSIDNVQVSDEGVYDVIVTGECTTSTSSPATLTVASNVNTFENSGITISPNPTSGLFTIYTANQNDIYGIVIKDISGRIISGTSNLKGNNIVSLQSFPKGVYFLQIILNKHQYCQKIMLQ